MLIIITNWLGKILFRSKTSVSNHDMDALGSLSPSSDQAELLKTRFSSFEQCVSDKVLSRHLLRLSEEILLNRDLNSFHLDIAGNHQLFTDCDIPVKSLIKYESAVAVFPLTGGEQSSFGHLWVFEDLDDHIKMNHLHKLEGSEEIVTSYPGLKVFVVSDTEFIGNSWKLAFHLARKALRDNQLKRKLALEWIVTGDVDSYGQTRKVNLGNKLALTTDRNWLLPRANYGDWPANWEPGGSVRVAGDVEEAVNRIARTTVQKAEPLAWPEKIKHIYSLSSKAETTVVVAAVLSCLNKLTLFTSSDQNLSIEPASNIKKFLKDHTDIQVTIAENRIPSDDVFAIERYIEKEMQLSKRTSDDELSIIHVTTGTKLMFLAASNIARNYPNVWLAYRDIGLNEKSTTDYTAIYYEGLQPTTRILKEHTGNKSRFAGSLTTKDLIDLLSSKFLTQRDD